MSNTYIDRQVELRAQAWEQAKTLIDSAAAEKRDLSAEENAIYARITADMEARAATITQLRADEQRELDFEKASEGIRGQVRNAPPATEDDAELIRRLARGEIREAHFEKRDVLTSNTGAPVPTGFYDRIVEHMVLVGPMLETSEIITTTTGESLQIPRTLAYSTAVITAQGSAAAESDPEFQAFITLGAYKEIFITQVSREMIDDSGVDLLGFLSKQSGIALGVAMNLALTTGTGSSQPKGIAVAAGTGVTGATAVTGAFTADNLIDLVYTPNSAYKRLPGTGWQMRGSTIAAVRKLKDTTNQYLFQPSLQAGQPDTLLGYPLWENPDMAAVGTAAISVVFGNLKSYYVRLVNGITFERSDDFAFSSDLVTFKARVRFDGNLPQQGAITAFRGGTA